MEDDMVTEKNFPEKGTLVEIQLIPLENDLESVAAVGLVGDVLRNDATILKDYQLVDVTQSEDVIDSKSRGVVELFQLVYDTVQNLHEHQDIIEMLMGTGLAALGLLLRQRRVKKVEVKLGEKVLVIQNADQRLVEKSLKQFEELCKEEGATMTAKSNIKIKASVSAKNTLNTNHP